MCEPSRPSPITPIVLPARLMPTGTPSWNFPARMLASPAGIARAAAISRPSASSAVAASRVAAAGGVAHDDAARGAGRRVERGVARAGHAQHAQLRQAVDQRCPAAACARASTARCRNRPASPRRRPRLSNALAKNTTSARACSGDQSALVLRHTLPVVQNRHLGHACLPLFGRARWRQWRRCASGGAPGRRWNVVAPL